MVRNLRSNSNSPNIWPIIHSQSTNQLQIMATAPATEWKVNPFHGNFNPATKTGQQIFLKKTEGLAEDKRLDLTKADGQKFHQFMKSREASLGNVVRKIPTLYANDGSVLTYGNLISQHGLVPLENIIREAQTHFATAVTYPTPVLDGPYAARDIDPENTAPDRIVFYSRVDSAVVAKLIENSLTPLGWSDLMLYKDKFSYVDQATGEILFDGPTMLKLIYLKVDPDTLVGMESLRVKLEKAQSSEHGNDVDVMLKMLEGTYKILKDNSHAPDTTSFCRYIVNALQSGKNHEFNSYIQRINDDIQSGIGIHKDISPEDLIQAARSKYNNMVEDKSWGKVDPKDAVIMALTTKLSALEKKVTAPPGNATPSNPSAHATSGVIIDAWRKKFDGNMKEVNGRKWWWCPKHKREGEYDGLYVTHHPNKHDENVAFWKKEKEARRSAKQSTESAANKKPTSTPTSSLTLNTKLKQVLITSACLSESDVDKILNEAQSEN